MSTLWSRTRRRDERDDQDELAVGGLVVAAVSPGSLVTTRICCPAATGECWRRRTVLSAQRCLYTLCPQSAHCNFAACAGAAGGIAAARSGRHRRNMAL